MDANRNTLKNFFTANLLVDFVKAPSFILTIYYLNWQSIESLGWHGDLSKLHRCTTAVAVSHAVGLMHQGVVLQRGGLASMPANQDIRQTRMKKKHLASPLSA
jgi:hypothetical protein